MKIYSNVQYLSVVVDRKLKKILALCYVSDKNIDYSSIQEIKLEFEGLKSVRIFCGVDGSSICWDTSDLQPISMDEYGEVKIYDLSNSEELGKDLINQKIEKVYLVTSEIENCIFAVKFVFSYDRELIVANIGDDLRLQKQLAPEILDEEKSQFLNIQEITREEF